MRSRIKVYPYDYEDAFNEAVKRSLIKETLKMLFEHGNISKESLDSNLERIKLGDEKTVNLINNLLNKKFKTITNEK